jgi:hypothetical protein
MKKDEERKRKKEKERKTDRQSVRENLARVTRLGEFSPNGRLFTMGSFLKIAEVAHIFRGYFFHS